MSVNQEVLIQGLTPPLAELCRKHIARCAEILAPNYIRLTSSIRTLAEQTALYAQGRDDYDKICLLRAYAKLYPLTEAEARKKVTWTMRSMHLPDEEGYSHAYDVVLVMADGRTVCWDIEADNDNDNIADWEEIVQAGRELGLVAGASFKKKDYAHFQLDI